MKPRHIITNEGLRYMKPWEQYLENGVVCALGAVVGLVAWALRPIYEVGASMEARRRRG
jgi:hypothetical protein